MIKFPKISADQRHLLVIGISSLSAMALIGLCIVALIGHILVLGEPSDGATAAAMAFAAAALVLEMFISIYGRREFQSHAKLLEHAKEAKTRTDELFAMTDMLQSADDHNDATAVLMASTKRLLPEFGAALYIYNNSRDRLDLAGTLNLPAAYEPAETLHPTNCWALKRGKPHINDPDSNTLCCTHHGSTVGTVEIPMMARESVYGLFVLAYDGDDAFDQLFTVRRLGRALADSMSLALSNISLREKLRTQSLRDPLTGLYNRRYMEDALERYLSLAERVGGSTSVVMLDLDYFKQLNDEHGHAKGDAVLRDVAAQLVGGLRPSDVVCRYGGEEFLVILPNCPLEDAAAKAEQLRERVESLSDAHGARISASFGVASVPATAATAADLIPQSDAALYRAKRDGKNRVQSADRRSPRDDKQPRLAVTG